MSYTIFDNLALSDLHFEQDHPKPFRLFAVGENHLTRNGKEFVLTLSAEDIKAIAAYQQRKDEKIPIDSRHALFLAARKANLTESEALKAIPSKVAALGFAALSAEPDGLYAADVELLPLGAELFRQGAFRYWSPVIRGLDGKSPLRVTSIAFDNVPALNGLDILAASDNLTSDLSDRSDLSDKKRKELTMTETEKVLRALLGDNELALSDNTDAEVAAKLVAVGEELTSLRADREKLSGLELAAETAKKEAVINQALAENRITNAEVEGLKKLDLAWLSAELPKRPATAVPVAKTTETEEDAASLSAEEKAFCKKMGLPEEEFIKNKKGVEK